MRAHLVLVASVCLGVFGCSSGGGASAVPSSMTGGQAATTSEGTTRCYAGLYTLDGQSLLMTNVSPSILTFSLSASGRTAIAPQRVWANGIDGAWRYTPAGATACSFTFEPSDDALSVKVKQEGDCAGVAETIPPGTYQRAPSFTPGTYETPRLMSGYSELDIESSDDKTVSLTIMTINAAGRTGGADHVTGERAADGSVTIAIDPAQPDACSLALSDSPMLGVMVTQTGSCDGVVGDGASFSGIYDMTQPN